MSESMTPLQNLFKAGITKEQFVQQYKELANSDSKDIALVFNFNNGITAEDVFDTLNINAKEENILEEADLQNLAQKYKEDGNNIISSNDITILYNEIYGQKTPQEINNAVIKQLEKENIYGFEDPQAKHDNAVWLNVSSLEYQIDSIDMLIENQKIKTKERIELLEQRIDNEILKNDKINLEFKEEYQKQVNEKKKNEKELKTKQEKLKKEQNNETPNSDKIEKLNTEIKDLKSKNSSITTNLKTMRNSVSDTQIKNYEAQINREEELCKNQIEQYNILKESIINTQNLAIETALSEIPSSNETIPIEDSEDENIIVTHDAKKLTQAWNSKKGVNLSESFVQKTMQVADNIGCDANDLLALMYSESSFRHDVQNNIGATGLIQFMPKTAKSLGTTTDALKNMSPEQQLDYVEKYFLKNKAAAGMSGKRMSAGDLYALTFLPARARNNVLTTSDEKYYKFNEGLDTNGDKKITIQDLSQRLRSYIPDAARKA